MESEFMDNYIINGEELERIMNSEYECELDTYIEFDTIKELCKFIGIGDYAAHTCMENHSKIKKGKYKGWYIESN